MGNFQYLFEKEFWENLTKFQLNQTADRKNEKKICLNKLNDLKFFKEMLKFSAFYLEKQKSFIPK